MKNKFSKLVSTLLIFAFLISAFSMFTFAAEGGEEGEEFDVLINRTFEEGWNYTNGMKTTSTARDSFTIEYEEDETYRYNYFIKLLAGSSTSANSIYFDFSNSYTAREGKTVFEEIRREKE